MQRISFSSQRGIVLPVVLVMLVLMTTVVLFLSRRSAIDERLAANVRGAVTLDTAAQYAMRWCEMWVWVSPPGIETPPGVTAPPLFMPAPPATAPAAWTDPASWDRFAVDLPRTTVEANGNVTTAQCLIEDASGELDLVGEHEKTGGAKLGGSETSARVDENVWRKYRITSEVTGDTAGVQLFARAQSEVRIPVY
jgi:hypothetical protein